MGLGMPIAGPGATVGTVETRVPRAGLLGPTTFFQKISLRTRHSKLGEALQAWRASSIFEEKTVDHMLTVIDVTDKSVTKEELMADDEAEASEKPAAKKKAPAKKKAGIGRAHV